MEEILVAMLAIFGAAFGFGVLLNPFFWQGLRNSKYWDERKKNASNSRDLADPDKM